MIHDTISKKTIGNLSIEIMSEDLKTLRIDLAKKIYFSYILDRNDLQNGLIKNKMNEMQDLQLNKEIFEKINEEGIIISENQQIGLKISKNDQILSINSIDFRESFKSGFKLTLSVFVSENDLKEDSMIFSFGNQTFIQIGVSLFSFHLLSSNDKIQKFPSSQDQFSLKNYYQVNKWNERNIVFNAFQNKLEQFVNGKNIPVDRIVDFKVLENLISILAIGKPLQLKYDGNIFEGHISNVHCSN
eukprot:gene8193-21_t